MPVTCGHCKESDQTVLHVKACSGNVPEVRAAHIFNTPVAPSRNTHESYVAAETNSPRLSNLPAAEAAGFYFKNETYFRVKVAKQSKVAYGSKWVDGAWEYIGKFICTQLRVSDRVTAEQAKAWAEAEHSCIFCGLELTDLRSTSVGYGPICAGKNGLPWGEDE